jgi:hypothetical protein
MAVSSRFRIISREFLALRPRRLPLAASPRRFMRISIFKPRYSTFRRRSQCGILAWRLGSKSLAVANAVDAEISFRRIGDWLVASGMRAFVGDAVTSIRSVNFTGSAERVVKKIKIFAVHFWKRSNPANPGHERTGSGWRTRSDERWANSPRRGHFRTFPDTRLNEGGEFSPARTFPDISGQAGLLQQ